MISLLKDNLWKKNLRGNVILLQTAKIFFYPDSYFKKNLNLIGAFFIYL